MHMGESALADTGRNFGLSGAALKWIAMITMLIDHIGAVVMEYGLYYQGGAETFEITNAALPLIGERHFCALKSGHPFGFLVNQRKNPIICSVQNRLTRHPEIKQLF